MEQRDASSNSGPYCSPSPARGDSFRRRYRELRKDHGHPGGLSQEGSLRTEDFIVDAHMVIDVWNILKTKGIRSKITVGNVERDLRYGTTDTDYIAGMNQPGFSQRSGRRNGSPSKPQGVTSSSRTLPTTVFAGMICPSKTPSSSRHSATRCCPISRLAGKRKMSLARTTAILQGRRPHGSC